MLQALLYSTQFSGLHGFSALGELSILASTYIMVALAPFFLKEFWVFKTAGHRSCILWPFVALCAVFILASMASLGQISNTYDLGRSGLSRFITATAVVMFGVYIALFVEVYLRNRQSHPTLIQTTVVRPLAIFTLLTGAVAVLEVASWFSPMAQSLYSPLSHLVHGSQTFAATPFRLRVFAGEPSFLGLWLAGVIPWMLAYVRDPLVGRLAKTALVVALLMAALTAARTAQLALVVMGLFYVVWRVVLSSPTASAGLSRTAAWAMLLFVPALLLLVAMSQDSISTYAIHSGNVSNITRAATIYSSFAIFGQNPFFGVGMGQVPFYLAESVPAWGTLSYEIMNYLFERTGAGAPLYSLTARILAETGLLGALAWYLTLGCFLLGVAKTAHQVSKNLKKPDPMGLALLLNWATVMASDFSSGSFRNTGLWILLGLGAAYTAAHATLKESKA